MLAAVERELADEPFVVIGVHSPKFPNERDADMVREAVRRYGITHPVVVDSDHGIWMRYGVSAWPTLVLVDPEGYVVGAGAGEPTRDGLLEACRRTIADARRRGVVSDAPLPLRREPVPAGSLGYPGKIGTWDGRIVVADTGHDQVVVARADGVEERRIGAGEAGFVDGAPDEARFRHPNGIAVTPDAIFVADTGNHAIRAIDPETFSVRTIAGTGAMGGGIVRARAAAREADLRSPWDLAWDGRRLFVAMAGAHQIWTLEPDEDRIGPFAGTGYELRLDGPARDAAFAQPSGIALLDGVLYVADSEVSTIRAIRDLAGEPVVSTVCGSGDLFGFGDSDGVGDDVLLQHPIGIAAGDGVLYLADTYNHKVKVVDPPTGRCETLFGAVEPERLAELAPGYALTPARPGAPAFFEPEGLAVRPGELLVADTNNHRILAVSLDDGARRTVLGG